METRASSNVLKSFGSLRKSLGDVDTAGVARLIAAASDIALVVDEDGKIQDAANSIPALQRLDIGAWIGRNWPDIVTPESRAKAERLLKDALGGAAAKWRELNHPLAGGAAAISYTAMQLGAKGRIVLLGRDLSTSSTLQQRLIAAQMETEREYARLRQSETRFATLFEASSEAMLIVTPGAYKIIEINSAGVELLGKSAKRIVGRSALDLFDTPGGRAVMTMLATVQGAGYSEEARAKLTERHGEVRVSAALVRHHRGEQYLVRLTPVGPGAAGGAIRNAPDVTAVVDAMPDAFVVADADFRVIRANAPFLDMVQVASAAQVRDQPLERWIGRPGIDLAAISEVLKQHGFVRNFQTIMRGEHGIDDDIEISALTIPDSDQPHISIAIRSVPRRRVSSLKGGRELPQSVEQMTELVGRVPLKEMVREATDWIERLSIEAALIVTGDNRASAADMLGFSRQSLYMKMRRYGLGDIEQDDGE